MSKERTLKEAKEYLMYSHEILRKSFNHAPAAENVFVDEVLKNLEIDVKQLEMLEEMLKAQKKTKKTDEEATNWK